MVFQGCAVHDTMRDHFSTNENPALDFIIMLQKNFFLALWLWDVGF